VHGGFVDGSGWEGVYGILKKDGYKVSVVQNPTLSLEDDVAVTRRVIDAQGETVVLVGHSYGGAVITEAGNDPNVAALVYVGAFAPGEGESVNTLLCWFPQGRTWAANLAAAGWIPFPRSGEVPRFFCRRCGCRPCRVHRRLAGPVGSGRPGRHNQRGRVEEQAKLVSDRDQRSDDPAPGPARDVCTSGRNR